MPLRLIRVNIIRINRAPTTTGKGRVTSPERYDIAVAAETIDVDAKSSKSRDAPIKAKFFDEAFNLETSQFDRPSTQRVVLTNMCRVLRRWARQRPALP